MSCSEKETNPDGSKTTEKGLQPPSVLPRRISDLDLMAQEGRIDGTLELDDGSSAAIDTTVSVAETRVELATSKVPTADSGFKSSRILIDDSDEGEDFIDDELSYESDTNRSSFMGKTGLKK